MLLTEDDIAGPRRQEWLDKGFVWAWLGEGVFLAEQLEGAEDLTELMNHSCDPNVWFDDEVTLVARQDIAVGEELTVDYAMFEGCEGMVSSWTCCCGSELCRGGFTGKDWRQADLQARYRGHFSPFLNERIQALSAREGPDSGQS